MGQKDFIGQAGITGLMGYFSPTTRYLSLAESPYIQMIL
jgi:hypothetical protein